MKELGHWKPLGVVLVLLIAFSITMSARTACAADPLTLKVAMFSTAKSSWTVGIRWIFDQIEERTNGRIKFKWYFTGTLVPARETLNGVKTGVADIAITGATLHPGETPLATVTSLPLIEKWFWSSGMAVQELLLEVPELKAELAQHNAMYLTHAQNSSYGLWSNFAVNSIADIKGKKIQVSGVMAKLIQALGAVTVTVTPTEIYTVLQRGTVDGSIGNPTYGVTYKWDEVCKYYYNYHFGSISPFVIINIDSWKKIPADIQQMFRDLQPEALKYAYEVYTSRGRQVLAEGKATGKLTITEPSAKDDAVIRKVAEENIYKDWIDKMEKKGLPAQKVFDSFVQILAKWQAQDPFKN